MKATTPVAPCARLLLPQANLGACIFAGVERDTRGCSLTDVERFNYYPATPMAMISWVFFGTFHMLEKHGPGQEVHLGPELPQLIFSGPQRKPITSWSPGSVHALSVAFYPESLKHILGISIEPYVDRILPLETVATESLMRVSELVLATESGQKAFHYLEELLMPLWRGPQVARPVIPLMGDWTRSLVTRAMFSTPGIGLRQIQRRIRRWTGRSHRDLQLFARVEETAARANSHRRDGTLDLAALAQSTGFSDQSHLGREIRRVTGFSPGQLNEFMDQNEAFWFYRLIEGHLDKNNVSRNK